MRSTPGPVRDEQALPAPAHVRAGRWRFRRGEDVASAADSRASSAHVTVVRVAFGLVWAIDAILKWQPGFLNSFGTSLDAAAKGQPGWLGPWFDLWTGLPHVEATALAFCSAATETFIATALLIGFARKSVYLLGVSYSLMIWATGEGFGGPYHSGSTDVGAAIIYALVFISLLVADRPGPNPYSVDSYLEDHIHWWHRIAEVGNPERRPREVETSPDAGSAKDRARTPVRIAVDVLDDN